MSDVPALDPGVGYVIALACALLFGHAAYGKWRGRAEFGAVLANYRILPKVLAGPLSVMVPALETAVALGVAPAASRPYAAATGATLLIVYALAIGINLRRGRFDLDCGCAGPSDRRPIAAWMIWRNVVLSVVLIAAAQPWSARALGGNDLLTIGGGLAVSTLLYIALDRLLGGVMPRTAALGSAR